MSPEELKEVIEEMRITDEFGDPIINEGSDRHGRSDDKVR